jgi:hypothetical protein
MTKIKEYLMIGIMALAILLVHTNLSKAEEPGLQMKVKEWFAQEWNEIKWYQKGAWENGKQQITRTKDQISGMFNRKSSN